MFTLCIQGIFKNLRIQLLETVVEKYHPAQPDVSIWTTELDQLTDGPSSSTIQSLSVSAVNSVGTFLNFSFCPISFITY